MICFYHPERPAVGLCRYCQRGLCAADAALIDDVLACQGRHEAQVKSLLLAEAKALLQSKQASGVYTRNAVFYGLVGAAFLVFGLAQLRWLGMQALFFIIIGLLLGYAALANYLESRRLR